MKFKFGYLLFCIALVGCEPWPASTAGWKLDDSVFICDDLPATQSILNWQGECAPIPFVDTLHPEFPNWKSSWPAPCALCTLNVANFRHGIPCPRQRITWEKSGAIKLLTEPYNSMQLFLLQHETMDEITTLADAICHQDPSMQNWWILPPAWLDTTLLHQKLKSCLAFTSLPNPWIPWTVEQVQRDAMSSVLDETITRAAFLAWPQRTISIATLDSMLLSHSGIQSSKALLVGPCPGTGTFWFARQEATRAQCGLGNTALDSVLPASGLTWEQARSCAERHSARLPTLAEWSCALGLWNDSLPWPWTSTQGISHIPTLAELSAWIKPDRSILPSDSLAPYPAGLYAMLGNVAEWLEDSSWSGNHFLAGGSYLNSGEIPGNPIHLEEIQTSTGPQDAGVRFLWVFPP